MSMNAKKEAFGMLVDKRRRHLMDVIHPGGVVTWQREDDTEGRKVVERIREHIKGIQKAITEWEEALVLYEQHK